MLRESPSAIHFPVSKKTLILKADHDYEKINNDAAAKIWRHTGTKIHQSFTRFT